MTSWDLVLDGRRRSELRFTVILDPGVGLVVWLPYAPPVTDGYRKSYQQLLTWNDELPFVKFGLDPELRLVLSAELPFRNLDATVVGLALARMLAVCDHLLPESLHWLTADGATPPGPARAPRGEHLLRRFARDLAELLDEGAGTEGT